MADRIRGGDAVRAAEATTERLPVTLQGTDLVEAGATTKPGSDLDQPKQRSASGNGSGPQLKRLGGSNDDDWNKILANQAISVGWYGNSSEDEARQQYMAYLTFLSGINPADELEGMLAAQLLASHNAAIECYRRAMNAQQTFEGRKENLNQANKLSRTYTALLEALNRHRGKGQQKVTVEHVHVHEGGQAIVGYVEGIGGGVRAKLEEQPHALGHAPGETLRSENEEREAVPVAGDGKR